jgi:sodium-dependent phosphate transporter
MKTENPYQRAYYTFPLVLIIGVGIDLFYVLYKASSNFSGFEEQLSLSWVLPVSFGTGALCGLIWIFIVGPIAKTKVAEHLANTPGSSMNASDKGKMSVSFKEPAYDEPSDLPEEAPTDTKTEAVSKRDSQEDTSNGSDDPPLAGWRGALKKFGDNTYNQDLHAQSMHENARAAKIWDQGETFDENAEQLFTYIQVFTACLNSFAHGANDVSNTIAPLSAIINIYQTGVVSSNTKVQKWVLAYGGIAIVLGWLPRHEIDRLQVDAHVSFSRCHSRPCLFVGRGDGFVQRTSCFFDSMHCRRYFRYWFGGRREKCSVVLPCSRLCGLGFFV